jgi:hypothetical protein
VANKKVSEFLTALAADPAMQTAWEDDPKQCALDFGVSPGQATKLAEAQASGDLTAVTQMLSQEGAAAKIYLWIKAR